MKKSIVLICSLSILCSISLIGQELTGTLNCPVARRPDVTCLSSDALHPVPGTPYTYSITVPAIPGTKSYRWIVTQEQTFLTDGILNTANAEAAGGSHLAAAGAELNSSTGEGIGEDIEITWKSFQHDPTRPVFLIIYIENIDGCTTQNLKAFQIEPRQAFTLDIANVRNSGEVPAYGESIESCVSAIASAKYDASAGGGMVYDYGKDYLFFAVTAAGFSGSWQPAFQLTGLTSAQTSLIEWSYPDNPGTWHAENEAVNVRSTSGTADPNGECILVRVTLSHHTEEMLAAAGITLAVDGTSGGVADIHHTDCSTDGFTNDFATHVLKPRPAIVKL